jgi:hypothetical protein
MSSNSSLSSRSAASSINEEIKQKFQAKSVFKNSSQSQQKIDGNLRSLILRYRNNNIFLCVSLYVIRHVKVFFSAQLNNFLLATNDLLKMGVDCCSLSVCLI